MEHAVSSPAESSLKKAEAGFATLFCFDLRCSLLKESHNKQSQCKFKLQFDSCCIAKVESADMQKCHFQFNKLSVQLPFTASMPPPQKK